MRTKSSLVLLGAFFSHLPPSIFLSVFLLLLLPSFLFHIIIIGVSLFSPLVVFSSISPVSLAYQPIANDNWITGHWINCIIAHHKYQWRSDQCWFCEIVAIDSYCSIIRFILIKLGASETTAPITSTNNQYINTCVNNQLLDINYPPLWNFGPNPSKTPSGLSDNQFFFSQTAGKRSDELS